MNLVQNNRKKMKLLAVTMLLSLLWLGYQVLLWSVGSQYLTGSREIIEFFQIPGMNRDTEWRRFTSVLCYWQTLPHVLLAYCLLQKWQGKGKPAWRVAAIAGVFLLSLVAIPRIAAQLFPSYRNILSPNHDGYFRILLVHGLTGFAGVVAVWLITMLRCRDKKLLQPRNLLRTAGRYGLTVAIAVLTAFAYGFILSILKHFNQNAVNAVLQSFGPDSSLISGILTMAVCAPLMEEMAFRGVIFSKTKKYSNVWVAVIFSSVLFGLWHRNLGQFFPTTMLGIVFAWIYQRTGKLRHSIIAHSLSNIVLAVALAKEGDYLPPLPLLTQVKNGLLELPLLAGIAGLGLVVFLIVLILKKGYPLVTEETQEFSAR